MSIRRLVFGGLRGDVGGMLAPLLIVVLESGGDRLPYLVIASSGQMDAITREDATREQLRSTRRPTEVSEEIDVATPQLPSLLLQLVSYELTIGISAVTGAVNSATTPTLATTTFVGCADPLIVGQGRGKDDGAVDVYKRQYSDPPLGSKNSTQHPVELTFMQHLL